jgi:hypothetical protein
VTLTVVAPANGPRPALRADVSAGGFVCYYERLADGWWEIIGWESLDPETAESLAKTALRLGSVSRSRYRYAPEEQCEL